MSYSNSRVGRYKSQKAWETVTGMLNRIPGGARKDAKAWSAVCTNSYFCMYKVSFISLIQLD